VCCSGPLDGKVFFLLALGSEQTSRAAFHFTLNDGQKSTGPLAVEQPNYTTLSLTN
jgi:hypothetical protein